MKRRFITLAIFVAVFAALLYGCRTINQVPGVSAGVSAGASAVASVVPTLPSIAPSLTATAIPTATPALTGTAALPAVSATTTK